MLLDRRVPESDVFGDIREAKQAVGQPDLSLFDYGLVWEWMSWVPCWVSILWMVRFGSGFVDVVVDDLIRWWCFAGCWVSILLLGFDLHVL